MMKDYEIQAISADKDTTTVNESPAETAKISEKDEPKPEPLEKVEDALTALMDELQRERDSKLRVMADYENYRRRTRVEFGQIVSSAAERIIKQLLPALDDYQRLFDHDTLKLDLDALKQGVQLIHRKIDAALADEGLQAVESTGKPFDPQFHEAVAQMEDPSQPPNTILTEVERGYKLNGKIIRHAKVVVSRAPEQDETGAHEERTDE